MGIPSGARTFAAGAVRAVSLAALCLTTLFLTAGALTLPAQAMPEAHIIRIDPRAGREAGTPVLTTLVEVLQPNSVADLLAECSKQKSFSNRMSCTSFNLEEGKLWSGMPFLKDNATLLVNVAGQDLPATLVGEPLTWKQSQKEKWMGTAWVVGLDASSAMGARYAEARTIAYKFLEDIVAQAASRPNDIVNVMIFNDQGIVLRSGWKRVQEVAAAAKLVSDQKTTFPSSGADRPLFDTLKKITVEAFSTLGNTQDKYEIPMHHAMVFLSNGAGRKDVSSSAPSAEAFHKYVTGGRFPEENKTSPRTPLPVISIWFPNAGGLVNETYRTNDMLFMQGLSNPEVGGFFDIVQEGQGTEKAPKIIAAVRKRFDAMYVAKWRVACLDPKIEQTFKYQYKDLSRPIKGDMFEAVPIGIDPTRWPLDIDAAMTKDYADKNPLFPGGTLKVFGRFCWSGDSRRSEAYFVPAGTQSDPNMQSPSLEAVLSAQQNLVSQNMRGSAKEVGDGFAIFTVPDEEKVVDGEGDDAVARVIVYDNVAKRASARDATTILTLRAKKRPLNALLLGGIGVAGLVIVLLLALLFKGGGGRKGRGGTPPGPPGGGHGGYGYGPQQHAPPYGPPPGPPGYRP